MVQQWHFFLLAPFCNLRGFVKHDNILRNMNFGNHLNETNVAISLRVGVANHLKLVRIYLRNPVCFEHLMMNITEVYPDGYPPE